MGGGRWEGRGWEGGGRMGVGRGEDEGAGRGVGGRGQEMCHWLAFRLT